MGTLQLVADSSRGNIPLTRNEIHETHADQPSVPSSAASSGLNFTQFMREAPMQF